MKVSGSRVIFLVTTKDLDETAYELSVKIYMIDLRSSSF